MKSKTPRQTAEQIADKLFSNHFDEVADRLVLMHERPPWSRESPRDLGGYCRNSVVAIIETAIRNEDING